MTLLRIFATIAAGLLLAACGDEPAAPKPQPAPAGPSRVTKSVNVAIQPAQPTTSDCLRAVVHGNLSRPDYLWLVNGRRVMPNADNLLCGESFKRGDQVSVTVGNREEGASSTVTIGNSPPKVTGISATPKQLFAGMDVEVAPVAGDADGDAVEFRYQWLVNGEASPFLTEARLPGDAFVKGDRIQVQITPSDGQNDGPMYQSYAMTIPNAPPQILSQPPQRFEALEYRYQVKAMDPDGDRLVYALTKSPQGMTVDRATGLVAWPLTGVPSGTYPLRVVVRDPDGAESLQEFTLTLGAPAPPPPAVSKP